MDPYLSLDAPGLPDDFYLNVVDWSSENVLAVGMGQFVYLRNGDNQEITKLCDFEEDQDCVTSVQWTEKGDFLAVGTNKGVTQVWDVHAQKKILQKQEPSTERENPYPLNHPANYWANPGPNVPLINANFFANVPAYPVPALPAPLPVLPPPAPNPVANRLYDLYTTNCIEPLAWNGELLCAGSKNGAIIQQDIRTPTEGNERRLTGHTRSVCGLKWSPDGNKLASSGNDNTIHLWDLHHVEPYQTYTEHKSSVKALAWSSHHRGVLVSGGGLQDKCLRFWNTLTGTPMQRIQTDAQITNVAWSKHSLELVTTHGERGGLLSYQLVHWKYPVLRPLPLMDHGSRVLYLASSPDGESVVTGAADEGLRFFRVFPKNKRPEMN